MPYILLRSPENGLSFLELSRPLVRPQGPNIEEEMHGPRLGQDQAPDRHFLLHIWSQAHPILQLSASQPLNIPGCFASGQLSSKKENKIHEVM